MDIRKANNLFKVALKYCFENHPDEIEWAKSVNENIFKNLKSRQFLYNYCWVVYSSGFKVSTVEKLFPALQIAFKNFDLNLLEKMRSIKPVLEVFNNERKARSFLEGVKMIANEGFTTYKRNLLKEGVDKLEALPGIGPVTKFHLAKNIGLLDKAKPDIWLQRAADKCSSSVDELVDYLSAQNKLSRHTVDIILWRFGADKGFNS